ncbi:hypothetical protein [Pseudomonas phage vB_Pa-PAC2]
MLCKEQISSSFLGIIAYTIYLNGHKNFQRTFEIFL